MNELVDHLRRELENPDVRYGYVEGAMNAFIAAQIKELREEREMSQQKLAEAIGTKQSGISRLENANYSSWKVETLRKLARALGVRLRISFEEFGTLIPEIEGLRKRLKPRKFEEDPLFNAPAVKEPAAMEPAMLKFLAGAGECSRKPFPEITPQGIHSLTKLLLKALELAKARSNTIPDTIGEKPEIHLVPKSTLVLVPKSTLAHLNPSPEVSAQTFNWPAA